MKPFLLPLLMFTSVLASATADTKAEWQARYKKIGQTIDKRDSKAFLAYLSPDFVDVDQDGKSFKMKEYSANMTQMLSSAKSASNVVVVTSVKDSNGSTLVGYSWKMKMTLSTAQGTALLSADETGVDTWKQTNGKWLMVKSVTKTYKQKIGPAPNGR